MEGEFQCCFSSFGIGRTEGKGRRRESTEYSTNKTMLAKTLEIPYPLIIISVFLWPFPYPVPFRVGLAISDEASLIFHTPGRKQATVQEREIIMLLPALGKETILNGTIVATAANLRCHTSRSISTFNLAENALLNFLSSSIYPFTATCTGPQTQFPDLKSCKILFTSSHVCWIW